MQQLKQGSQAKDTAAMSELKRQIIDKNRTICEEDVITFRPWPSVVGMLNEAMQHFSNRSEVINSALEIGLKQSGFKAPVVSRTDSRKKK